MHLLFRGEVGVRIAADDAVGQVHRAQFFDEGGDGIGDYVSSIEYRYNVTPQVFSGNTEGEVRQINPDTTFEAFGMGGGSSSRRPPS